MRSSAEEFHSPSTNALQHIVYESLNGLTLLTRGKKLVEEICLDRGSAVIDLLQVCNDDNGGKYGTVDAKGADRRFQEGRDQVEELATMHSWEVGVALRAFPASRKTKNRVEKNADGIVARHDLRREQMAGYPILWHDIKRNGRS